MPSTDSQTYRATADAATYPEQRAAGQQPQWEVNDEQGVGLLVLPQLTPPTVYRRVLDEIEAQGYQVVEHDEWYLHMAGRTYYRLVRA